MQDWWETATLKAKIGVVTAREPIFLGLSKKASTYHLITHYIIAPATDSSPAITLSQKDIRSVQLGKAALVSGIEFLLRTANMLNPKKILVAGAFGSHLDRDDMLADGLLPPLPPEQVAMVGNAAGAGAIMALCDQGCIATAQKLIDMTSVVNLAANIDFQKTFISRLAFPGPSAGRLD